jgi:hypothetical protein
VALVVALLRHWAARRPAPAPPAPPLAPGEWSAIVGIEYAGAATQLTLERVGEHWWIRAPIRDLANTRLVRELLRALEELEVRRVFETDSLARYGLDPAVSSLRLRRQDGGRLEVRVGGVAPASGDVYAVWTGLDGVAIVPRFVVARFFGASLFDWRERELIPPLARSVDSIRVETADGALRARRRSAGSWEFLEPRDREADALSCERTVAGFGRFSFGGFVDDPASWRALGLEPPRAAWTIYRGGRADTLHVGARIDPQTMILRLAGRAPGRAPADLYEFLTGGVGALESRALVRGPSREVACVLLAGAPGGRMYVRGGGRWRTAAVPAGRLARLEAGALADTAGLAWNAPEDPALTGDVADLYDLRGERWLGTLARPPERGGYPMRLHLWSAAGEHQWAFFAGATQAPADSAGAPTFVGRAVGSRFPLRPMAVRSENLARWARRLERRARADRD